MTATEPLVGLDVILIEDNEDDVELVRRLLARSGLSARLHVAMDADQARELLLGCGASNNYEQRVVLLDLQLPSEDGREILRWMRTEPKLGSLHAVVVTSSSEHERISECLELGCRMYLLKPIDIADVANIVWGIRRLWGRVQGTEHEDTKVA